MKKINGGEFTGERSLFKARDTEITGARFFDGESPLKESENISIDDCVFEWKYPLWYSKNVKVSNTLLKDTARSGIWYTDGIEMNSCTIEAPKTFRRSKNITLKGVRLPNAQESMWNCENMTLLNVYVRGDYFGFGSKHITASDFSVDGNYLFDGASDVVIRGAKLISKDAFWNCERVTVCDSLIVGEYLGWNSKDVTFINCDIESNQGLCYMENVTLKNCRLKNTDLCFEYCTVDAEIDSHIDSVKNPISGRITADSIGEIILDDDDIDHAATVVEEVKKNV